MPDGIDRTKVISFCVVILKATIYVWKEILWTDDVIRLLKICYINK